jgi:hypothetical protein
LTELYSSVERGLIDRHPSTWTPQEVVNATWRQESIGVLLWALSEYEELPPYDSEFANVAEVVPVLAPTEQFVTQAVLRPDDEIETGSRCRRALALALTHDPTSERA